MSTQDPKWEQELRSRLREHEFGFDPAAWTQMTGLLDKVTPPPPTGGTEGGGPAPSQSGTAAGGWSAGLITKVIVGVVALGVTAAVVLRQEPATEDLGRTEDVTVTEAPEEDAEPNFSVVQAPPELRKPWVAAAPRIIEDRNKIVADESSEPRPVAPLPPRAVRLAPIPPPWPEPATRTQQEIPELTPTDLSSFQLAVPNRVPADSVLRARLWVPPPRKRNRKTLFPDVIEKN